MKNGDRVWITCEGRRVAGWVILASENQKSIALGFEAMLSGHVNMMPAFLGEDGVYRSILSNVPVEIEPMETLH